jgi:hypothetical protein
MRIVAYTAAFGSQPAPHTPPIDVDVPLVCYTDRADLVAPGYEVRVVRPAFPNPRLAARYVKIKAHEVLEPVDWAIWFDAEVLFKTGRLRRLVSTVAPRSFAAHAHPVRRCVYVEATVCKRARLDDPARIAALMARYRRLGHPSRAGLFESGLLVRRLTDPAVVRLNERWWREVRDGSIRDQLSLPVVLRQMGLPVQTLPGFIFNSSICALAGRMSSGAPARNVPGAVPPPIPWGALYAPAPASMLRRARRHLASRPLLDAGLFDSDFYQSQAGCGSMPRPLGHYLTDGWRRELDPHPLFDVSFYLERSPDVRASRAEPLGHYVDRGGREGRSPHALFDVLWYERQYGRECSDVKGGSLGHYLKTGWKRGHRPNAWFDPVAYLRRYPDVARANVEPFGHFLRYGGQEGRVGLEHGGRAPGETAENAGSP